MAVLTAPRDRDVLATDSLAAPTLRLSRRGENGQRTVPLSSGKYTVGSSPQCQICLPSPEVRPLQCLIALESNAAFVTRWAAGVLLNGNEFSKAELKDGDRLTIGDWEIEFARGGSMDAEPAACDDEALLSELAMESPPEVALPADVQPAVVTPREPAECHSSQAFADSLVLHLWTANDRARSRAKALITGIRAAHFHADALAADLSAMETELDLARAAYDSHLSNNDRLQQELAEQHKQRVTPLVEEIAALKSQLAAAEAQISRQTAEFKTLSDELAALRMAAQTPTVDPALAKRAEELEAAVVVLSQELEKLTDELRLAQQEQERLTGLYQIEADCAAQEAERATLAAKRAEELEAVVAAHPRELEQLAGELRLAQQEQERLVELHRIEAERAVQEVERAAEAAKRAAELEATVAAHPQVLELLTGELRLAQQEKARLADLYQIEAGLAVQLEQQLAEQQAQLAAAVEQIRVAASAATSVEQTTAAEDSWEDGESTVEAPLTVAEPDAPSASTLQAVEETSPSPQEAADAAEPEVATPTPEAEQSAPEYKPTSFIDTYRHLLDADDAPVTQTTSPRGGRPILDEEYLSPAKVETCAIPADESDDALEAYMANMMRRVRNSSPSYASSQAVPIDKSENAGVGGNQPSEPSAYPADDSAGEDSLPQEPFSLETMKQATRKLPLSSDMASLREIANCTARTAIATHSQRRSRESAFGKMVIALTAMPLAAYLMASAPAITDWQFWAGLTTCVVGIASAAQTLIIERRRASELAE